MSSIVKKGSNPLDEYGIVKGSEDYVAIQDEVASGRKTLDEAAMTLGYSKVSDSVVALHDDSANVPDLGTCELLETAATIQEAHDEDYLEGRELVRQVANSARRGFGQGVRDGVIEEQRVTSSFRLGCVEGIREALRIQKA